MPAIKTRESDVDTEGVNERIRSARAEGRKRTIFLSVICSGFISLFIGYALEVEVSNSQVDRSRQNCNSIQADRILHIRQLDDAAYQVLGGGPKHLKAFVFKNTAFAQFEPLIIAQAHTSLKQARQIRARLENCNKVFPKRSPIVFIG